MDTFTRLARLALAAPILTLLVFVGCRGGAGDEPAPVAPLATPVATALTTESTQAEAPTVSNDTIDTVEEEPMQMSTPLPLPTLALGPAISTTLRIGNAYTLTLPPRWQALQVPTDEELTGEAPFGQLLALLEAHQQLDAAALLVDEAAIEQATSDVPEVINGITLIRISSTDITPGSYASGLAILLAEQAEIGDASVIVEEEMVDTLRPNNEPAATVHLRQQIELPDGAALSIDSYQIVFFDADGEHLIVLMAYSTTERFPEVRAAAEAVTRSLTFIESQ